MNKNCIFPIAIMSILIATVITMTSYANRKNREIIKEIEQNRRFNVGDIVKTKIGNKYGMIIDVYSFDYKYDVRIDVNNNAPVAIANSSSNIIGNNLKDNGAVLPIITMYEYELEAVNN